jgi:predicted lipid carrier protein YhbT
MKATAISAGEQPQTLAAVPRLPKIFRHLPPTVAALPLGPALTLSLRSLARRRPRLFERLGQYGSWRYFVDPVDLAFAFTIVPDAERSVVRVESKSGTATSNVVIRGPLLALLGLLDGQLDGDALFFNRVISISGRTEAVVALRNAIEDAELSPADLLGLTGPLARLANDGILGGLNVARRLAASAPAAPARMP